MKKSLKTWLVICAVAGAASIAHMLHAAVGAAAIKSTTLPLSATNIALLNSLSDDDLGTLMAALANTPTISAELLPRSGLGGTYFSLQHPNWPPLPGDMTGVPVWQLSGGCYLLNDLEVIYGTPLSANLSMSFNGVQAMSVPSPGGGSGGGSGANYYSGIAPINFGTNLWVDLLNVSNQLASLVVSNTESDILYEIQARTNLAVGTCGNDHYARH